MGFQFPNGFQFAKVFSDYCEGVSMEREEGVILLNVPETTLICNKAALDGAERECLAERLATRLGEHLLHDCTGRVQKIWGSFVWALIFQGGLQAYVKIEGADYFRFCGIEEGERFFCRVTTRGKRQVLRNSPIFQEPKILPVSDMYDVCRLKQHRH